MASEPYFEGFTPGALRLLTSLERHNDREWFAPRKERFQRELLDPMLTLVTAAARELQAARLPLAGDKRSVMRIYRDLRFTPDKRPYRPYLAAYLSPDAGRGTPGGVYVHVAPRAPFVAVAFYQLERPLLQRWRETMAREPRSFSAVLRALDRNGVTIEGPAQTEDALTRMPRGYTELEQSPLAPYFRLRSFVVRRSLPPEALLSAEIVSRIVELARAGKPLLEFGWRLV